MAKPVASVFLFAFVSATASAQHADIPLTNWTVPPYTQSASGGMTTMTDVTPPRVFIGVAPCRIVDTRAGSAFPAGFGIPSLAPGVPRNFDLDNGPCPGLPVGINAYSLNVTVTNTAGPGHLVIYPQGSAQPTVSSINYVAGQTIANAVIVPAGTFSGVTVVAGVSGTDLLIDINGYFSDEIGNGQNFLQLFTNSNQFAAAFGNLSTTCTGICGVSVSAQHGSALRGHAFQTDGSVYGVEGMIGGAADSAGVWGRGNISVNIPSGYSAAGVRGTAVATGVLGIARVHGVLGDLVDDAGDVVARGILGFDGDGGATKYAVWGGTGNFGGTGVKSFVEPHPSDPAKVIRYVSLEGPEAGTYFRGRGKIERGLARIAVPEDFRMVSDEEGLTVQVTPIGSMASFAVTKVDLNEIVVQSSRNVEFFYLVQGVRRTYKDFVPIGEGREYMPERADARLPHGLVQGQKELLIRNGTYNADGTVNMDTARRLGWDKVWERLARPAPQPASK